MLNKTDLKGIQKIVKEENVVLEKRLNRNIKKIDNKLDFVTKFLDKEYLRLLKRVERIEKHLGLEPISV